MTATDPSQQSADNSGRLPSSEAANPELGSAEPARRIAEELELHPRVDGFLRKASQQLVAISDEITANLGIEAVRAARRRRATAVDVEDVKAADLKLNNPDFVQAVRSYLLTLGSLLLGAGLSVAVTLLLLPDPPPRPGIWWAIAGVQVSSSVPA